VSRILADERFLTKRRSGKEVVGEVMHDLQTARELIEQDLLSESDKKVVTKWLTLNRIKL
jgi:hypothetical protein